MGMNNAAMKVAAKTNAAILQRFFGVKFYPLL